MFHGRKKQKARTLSEEELKQRDEKLKKIKLVNTKMLKQRSDKVYDEASLGQTEKFAKLSPDFTTVWNYRREILEHLFAQGEGSFSTLEGKLGVIKTELKMLIAHLKSSPKSYSIWQHRVWTIELGLTLERQFLDLLKAKKMAEKAAMEEVAEGKDDKNGDDDEGAELINMPGQETSTAEDDSLWKSAILDTEMKLCSMMLMEDERNFHCWNYRKMMVDLYRKEIDRRVPAENAKAIKNKYLQSECDTAKAIINKNFSNYSAWHYRGKLMAYMEEECASGPYVLPLASIKEDLQQLKHAYFTDPKDQSPWNYHGWLMSLISPIQVVALRYLADCGDGKAGLVIGLSHQVKNFHLLDISLVDKQGEPIRMEVTSAVLARKTLSNSWLIKIDQSYVESSDTNSFTLSIGESSSSSEKGQAETSDGHKLLRKFLIHIDVNRNVETDRFHATFELPERQVYAQSNGLLSSLNEVLLSELANIRELTSFETGLQFAQLRQLELIRCQYEYLTNPFYNDLDESLEAPFAFQLETEIHDLAAKLESECEADSQPQRAKFFQQINKSFTNIKLQWQKYQESSSLSPKYFATLPKEEFQDRHRGWFCH